MSDPIDELRKLADSGLPGAPLPPREVRRLGDRMRRRRHALTAIGAGVAVVVVASGGLFVTQNLTSTPPLPGPATHSPSQVPETEESPAPAESPTPEVGLLTDIPADFPLEHGLPEPGGDVPAYVTSDRTDLPWNGLPCSPTQPWTAPGDTTRTDARYVEVQPPAAAMSRQLVVYPDVTTGSEVVDAIRERAEACPPLETIPGAAEFRWATSDTTVGDHPALLLAGGDYAVDSDERAIGRVLVAVVRERNAVLVASLSDESSADPLDLEEGDAAAFVEDVTTVADAMCVFAAEPCGDSSASGQAPAEQPTPSPSAEPVVLPEPVLNDGDLVVAEQIPVLQDASAWRQVGTNNVPTLNCQPAWLSSLGTTEALFREFRSSRNGREVGETNTAVLLFPSQESASDAYATLLGWVERCDERLDDTREVFQTDPEPASVLITGGEAQWRLVQLSAPEICQECDAVWFDRQGAALLGDRVVVVSQAVLGGPREPDGLRSSMHKTLRAAAQAAR